MDKGLPEIVDERLHLDALLDKLKSSCSELISNLEEFSTQAFYNSYKSFVVRPIPRLSGGSSRSSFDSLQSILVRAIVAVEVSVWTLSEQLDQGGNKVLPQLSDKCSRRALLKWFSRDFERLRQLCLESLKDISPMSTSELESKFRGPLLSWRRKNAPDCMTEFEVNELWPVITYGVLLLHAASFRKGDMKNA